MKQLIDKILISLSLLFIIGCSTKAEISPSENSALNNISNSGKKEKKGFLQNSLDSFIEEDWTPTLNENKEIQEKYEEEEEKSFTLQEFVDKSEAYLDAHPSDHENSNVHKLESMPVIGNSKKR